MLSSDAPPQLSGIGTQHLIPFGTVRSNRTEQKPSVRSYLVERCRKERGAWGRYRKAGKKHQERAGAGELGGRQESMCRGVEEEARKERGDGRKGGDAGKKEGGSAEE